jgi:hypothetical protein
MDSLGKFIIATGVTIGGAVLGASYMNKYWEETRKQWFEKPL